MCSRPPEIEAVYILKILGQVSLGVWSKQHWQDMTGGNGRLLGWVATGQHWPALATCSSLLVAEIQDMSKSLPEGVFNPGQALANRPQLKKVVDSYEDFLVAFFYGEFVKEFVWIEVVSESEKWAPASPAPYCPSLCSRASNSLSSLWHIGTRGPAHTRVRDPIALSIPT